LLDRVAGSLAALEVIREIVGFGEGLLMTQSEKRD
jgi:hypothetical protein